MNHDELKKLLENNASDLKKILELAFYFGSQHGLTGMMSGSGAEDLSARIAQEATKCAEGQPMFGIIYFDKHPNGMYNITYIKPR